MSSYVREWWLGLRFMGKLLLFSVIFAIAGSPISMIYSMLKHPQWATLAAGPRFAIIAYWILVVALLPWIYARVGRALDLLKEPEE